MYQDLSRDKSYYSHLMNDQQPGDRKIDTFTWEQPLDRERFCLLAQLLYLKNQQQPLSCASSKIDPSTGNARNVPLADEDSSSDESTEPRQLVSEKPLDGLKRRFLDRLAEVLAREKKSFANARGSKHNRRNSTPVKDKLKNNFSQEASLSGNSHTAAASLIEQNGAAIILVAKNCGLDNADRSMIDRLSQWIQVIAKTGVRPSEKDSFWRKLLLYCEAWIIFYVTEIHDITKTCNLVSPSRNTDSVKYKVYQLISLCTELQSCQPEDFEVKIDSMSELACLAYELRSCVSLTTLLEDLTPKFKMLRLKIALLGRYRGAYETFKEAAMHFHGFKELDMQEVELVATAKLTVDLPFVTKSLASLNITPKSSGQSAQSLCNHVDWSVAIMPRCKY